jgi:hypothetical protein
MVFSGSKKKTEKTKKTKRKEKCLKMVSIHVGRSLQREKECSGGEI